MVTWLDCRHDAASEAKMATKASNQPCAAGRGRLCARCNHLFVSGCKFEHYHILMYSPPPIFICLSWFSWRTILFGAWMRILAF
jgi:hypothetical protein